jgi:hypothetical protein
VGDYQTFTGEKMKIHTKKKAYRKACREKVVKDGLVNAANGNWVRRDSSKVQDNSMAAGYRVR